MIKQLLEEVRGVPARRGRPRPAARHLRALDQGAGGRAWRPSWSRSWSGCRCRSTEGTVPSEAELRIAQAQLVGWLEGLFHGIQTALFAQQMAARAQLEQIRRQALPRGPGGPGGRAAPTGPTTTSRTAPAGPISSGTPGPGSAPPPSGRRPPRRPAAARRRAGAAAAGRPPPSVTGAIETITSSSRPWSANCPTSSPPPVSQTSRPPRPRPSPRAPAARRRTRTGRRPPARPAGRGG